MIGALISTGLSKSRARSAPSKPGVDGEDPPEDERGTGHQPDVSAGRRSCGPFSRAGVRGGAIRTGTGVSLLELVGKAGSRGRAAAARAAARRRRSGRRPPRPRSGRSPPRRRLPPERRSALSPTPYSAPAAPSRRAAPSRLAFIDTLSSPSPRCVQLDSLATWASTSRRPSRSLSSTAVSSARGPPRCR